MPIEQSFTGQFVILCWITFLVYWIAKASQVKRNIERRSLWWWRIPPFAMLTLIYVSLKSGGRLSEYLVVILWPSASNNFIVGVVADIVSLTGLIITLWARMTLGRNWNTGVTFKENHELVKHGPYSFVRHPIYSGLLLMFLSMAIWYGRVAGFAFFASCFVAYWVKAINEENLMMQHFPNEYPEYKKNVKALIPFVF